MSQSSCGGGVRRHRSVVLSLLVFVGATAWGRFGWASSCGDVWLPSDADVIFQGQAIEVHDPLHLRFRRTGASRATGLACGLWLAAARSLDDDVRTVFRVSRGWRGTPSQFVTVNTGPWLRFEVGKEYVVYAAKDDGELYVGSCAGTALPGSALPADDAATLGIGTPPSRGGRGVPMFWRHLLLPSAVVMPILLTATIWAWLTRRRATLTPHA